MEHRSNEDRQFSLNEKIQRIQMEKEATWWTKYYALKAKLGNLVAKQISSSIRFIDFSFRN